MLPATKVTVTTAQVTYDVHIGSGLFATLSDEIAALLPTPAKLFVVTSPEIWRLWHAPFLASFPTAPAALLVPAGEEHKRLAILESLAEKLSEAGADRDSVLIAFGGGVIGDMTGFLAAMYMRGIRYIGVPTTLLAQVDSSLGGKTGVNLSTGKNLIGAFHHPLAVFADTAVLRTLPPRELRAGLQEAVKAAIIRDRGLFDLMDAQSGAIAAGDPTRLAEVITRSVRVKAEIVAADEREGGVRMLLNLGHTLGHAIETATGYTQLLHGEAVAWGMMAALGIAVNRATITAKEAEQIARVIAWYGPLRKFTADAATLVANTARDKKNRGGARSFVLPVSIGDATVVNDVTESELLTVANDILILARGAK